MPKGPNSEMLTDVGSLSVPLFFLSVQKSRLGRGCVFTAFASLVRARYMTNLSADTRFQLEKRGLALAARHADT